MVAGVEREAPMRIACGSACRQAIITDADGGGGYGGGGDHGHHVRCPGQAAHLGHGTRYQDQPDELSYRIKALDPDAMLDQRFDEQLRGCVPNGTGSRRCPPSPTGGTSSPPGTCTPTSTRPSPLRTRRVADLARVRGRRDEETGQRDPGRRERDSSPRVTVVCSGRKVQPFQVAVNSSPQDGQVWLLVSLPGTHAPSNLLPQPGQSSGECSVILIPERSSLPSLWRGWMGGQPWRSFPFQVTAYPVRPANHRAAT